MCAFARQNANSSLQDVGDQLGGAGLPGLFVADNAGWSPDYLARVRSPAAGYMSLPFGSDVELSIWTGQSVS